MFLNGTHLIQICQFFSKTKKNAIEMKVISKQMTKIHEKFFWQNYEIFALEHSCIKKYLI